MRRILSVGVVLGLIGAGLLLAPWPILGQGASRFDRETVNGRDVVAREVLVKLRQPPVAAALAQLGADGDADNVRAIGRAGIIHLHSRSRNVAALIAALSLRPDVAYVEPNFIVRAISEPNDPRYPELWALRNIGQLIGGVPGKSGADIHAVPAWNITLGSTANVVAVIDTGIDYTHADLAANMWSAPSAFTINVAGGPVTCAAGTHGFNAITRSCDPMDDEDHGTHVAGTIGATGDNGTGVVGVNWTTRLMAIKFIDAAGNGTTADAIAAMEFALAVKERFAATDGANIRVLSNSWGGPDFSQALLDEVNAANDAEMLFVAGAGNDAFDNDIEPFYPASFDAPNVVSVTATDNLDDLAWFSNYGASSVDIGAPGVDILSTTIGNHYQYLSGTSMATPHVSGAAALMLSQCALNTADLKEAILGTAEPLPVLSSITTSGGRVDVYSGLYACIAPPLTPSNLAARGDDMRVRLSWSASLGAIRYNVKRSLTPGGPYTSINANVHGTAYVDTGLTNGTTYYYVVSASNSQGESGDSNEASATANIPPDVIVSSFSAPSASGAGATVSISVTTRNQGLGTAAPSTTRFYFSDNSTFGASDMPLDAVAVSQLLAGGSSATSVSVVIPATTTGTHYLIARVDDEDVLDESNENNNTLARSIVIGPDLTVSALTVPGNGGSDASIVVNETTRNQGGGLAATSATRFYLSTNSTLDASDTLLGGRDITALDPGITNSGATTLMIPPATPPGTYYIVAKADADAVVSETSETNNVTARSIVIGSDLVVSAMTIPAKGAPGGSITIADTTSNAGGGAAGASVTEFYLSTNSVFDAADTRLASHAVPDLAPGANDAGSTLVALPIVPGGTYYIIAKADDTNAVIESKETNNTLARAIAIGGDLVVTALAAPSVGGAGVPLTVNDSTMNQGGGAVGPTTTRFYLSPNSVYDDTDTPLGARDVGALDAGATSSGSATLTIPPSTLPGSYYIVGRADADGVAAETTETNNITARSIVIGSDLAVTASTVPAKAGSGTTISVSDTTANLGGGPAAASTTRFYLSTNSTLDSGDTLLAGTHAVPDLAPGAVHTAATSLTIPVVTSGTYYVIAKADDADVVVESKENNNTFARAIAIGGDLAITVLTVPAEGGAGAPLTVSDTTANQGGGSVGPTATKFYLSSNSTFDLSDTLIGGRAVPALAAGGTSSAQTTLTIPSGLPAGTYYVIARADGDDALVETSEANNTLARAAQIGSDLAVVVVTPPAKAAAGASIVVSDTTTNQGGGDAPASVTAFYLSATSGGGAGDVLLDGSRAVPALPAGASSSGSTTVTIPAGTAAGSFYIIARADNGNVVAETLENNNTRSRTISIGPDLAIPSTISLSPSTVAAGAALTISETVTNQGGGPAAASTTRFYLSTNAVLDAADVLLAPGRAVPSLGAGASSAGATVVTIPNDTAARSYYIIAQADADGVVAESLETNNLSPARFIQVTAP